MFPNQQKHQLQKAPGKVCAEISSTTCCASALLTVVLIYAKSATKGAGKAEAGHILHVSAAQNWCSNLTTHCVTKGFSFFKMNFDNESKSFISL